MILCQERVYKFTSHCAIIKVKSGDRAWLRRRHNNLKFMNIFTLVYSLEPLLELRVLCPMPIAQRQPFERYVVSRNSFSKSISRNLHGTLRNLSHRLVLYPVRDLLDHPFHLAFHLAFHHQHYHPDPSPSSPCSSASVYRQSTACRVVANRVG